MNEVIKNFNLDSIKIKIPKRSKESHKGNFGKVLVYGGSNGMGGAAILASEASLFCGAGLVYLHTHSSNVEASLKRNPEVMVVGINSEYKIEFTIISEEAFKNYYTEKGWVQSFFDLEIDPL